MIVVSTGIAYVIASVLAMLRWIRVAQREHYLPGSVGVFARRWWLGSAINVALVLAVAISFVALVTQIVSPFVAIAVPALIVALGPIGLSLRGRTSPLRWTARARRVGAVSGTISLLILIFGLWLGGVIGGTMMLLGIVVVPSIIDVALLALRPVEHRMGERFVDQAAKRLREVKPRIVGITGSYGKTSTKGYVAHLLAGEVAVVPTPASFNNRAGLCRAINEGLSPGTEVFLAEMGTYGKGEIAELAAFCPPEIAVLTAIGPVHLERFKTEEAIVAAKSEIFATARTCVLNVDDARIDALVPSLLAEEKCVMRVSARDREVDVAVIPRGADSAEVFLHGDSQGLSHVPSGAPTNMAAAIAVALSCGVSITDVMEKLPTLPTPAHRQTVTKLDSGVTVIDDTFNANPSSVRQALDVLRQRAGGHATRSIVVTPGMVELGSRQREENEAFGKAAGIAATDVVIVGTTNRRALQQGLRATRARVHTALTLPQAVEWVKTNAVSGDVVLYANDLPDHFA